MFRFLVFAAACFLLYKLYTNDRKKKAQLKAEEDEARAKEGVLVKDPVCGTYVSKDSGIRVKDDDGVHCFCSYECRDKYIEKLES
jgi:YHS domain-containing protein